jgi:hypothetical protein
VSSRVEIFVEHVALNLYSIVVIIVLAVVVCVVEWQKQRGQRINFLIYIYHRDI